MLKYLVEKMFDFVAKSCVEVDKFGSTSYEGLQRCQKCPEYNGQFESLVRFGWIETKRFAKIQN